MVGSLAVVAKVISCFWFQVEVLDLSGNEIPECHFPHDLPLLREVNLSRNILTRAVFPSLPALRKLDLSFNSIQDLKNVVITNLTSLQQLNVSRNKIQGQVPPIRNKSLKILDLSFSHMSGFDGDCLKDLPNLNTLILSNSAVKIFAHLHSESVENLDLSGCQMSHLTSDKIRRFPKLVSIDVSNNKNLRLSLEGDCVPLQSAQFSSTGLSDIAIFSLCALKDVSFAYNSIQNIDELTFQHNPKLNSLNVSFNNLKYISEKAFQKNSLLATVDLSNNYLSTAGWTQFLQRVRYLNLSSNKIERTDDFKLPKIEYLDLSNNVISYLELSPSEDFPEILFLNLRFNRIERVPPMKSDTLKNLELGYNQISLLNHDTFQLLTNLRFLDLEGNKLKRLDFKTLAGIRNLLDVSLAHNPWTCDCESEQFQNLFTYLLLNNSLATDGGSLRCDEVGGTWYQVCPPVQPHRPTSSNSHAFIALGIFVVLALLGTLGVVYCKARMVKVTLPHGEPPPPQENLHRLNATIPPP